MKKFFRIEKASVFFILSYVFPFAFVFMDGGRSFLAALRMSVLVWLGLYLGFCVLRFFGERHEAKQKLLRDGPGYWNGFRKG